MEPTFVCCILYHLPQATHNENEELPGAEVSVQPPAGRRGWAGAGSVAGVSPGVEPGPIATVAALVWQVGGRDTEDGLRADIDATAANPVQRVGDQNGESGEGVSPRAGARVQRGGDVGCGILSQEEEQRYGGVSSTLPTRIQCEPLIKSYSKYGRSMLHRLLNGVRRKCCKLCTESKHKFMWRSNFAGPLMNMAMSEWFPRHESALTWVYCLAG